MGDQNTLGHSLGVTNPGRNGVIGIVAGIHGDPGEWEIIDAKDDGSPYDGEVHNENPGNGSPAHSKPSGDITNRRSMDKIP